jgi:hypothetical protein
VRVQSFSSASQVKPGHAASFAVWVWSAKAPSYGVTVKVHVAWAMYIRTPSFTVCPVASGETCKMGNVPVGQSDELQVKVPVGSKAALGEQVQLTATASASAAKSFSGSATDVVVAQPKPSTIAPTTPTGVTTLPPVTLPPISGSSTSPGDASGLFPTVGPSPSSSADPVGLPPPVKPHKSVRVVEAAATVPLDSRLIGGQLAGLAVLAGAVIIAIARLSLRAPKPTEDKGDKKPPSQ